MFGADTIFSGNASSRAPLASHPAFAWIMILWCALLFGLASFVIAAAFSSSSLLPAGLGFVAAIVGALCGWQFCKSVGARMPELDGVAGIVRSKFARDNDVAADQPEASASIMSTQELGSTSLDAPLEETPSANLDETDLAVSEAQIVAAHDFDAGEPAAYFEDPFAEDGLEGPASPNDRHAGPALGRPQFPSGALSFGALEDRPEDANMATDVLELAEELSDDALPLDSFELAKEAPAEQPVAATEQGPEKSPEQSSALETRREADVIALKDRDLNDLSLVQMVERFAVGLEGHRVARSNDPASRAIRPSDPRIAQAIRALPIGDLRQADSDCATRTQAEETEAALREALEKLQRMSDHA